LAAASIHDAFGEDARFGALFSRIDSCFIFPAEFAPAAMLITRKVRGQNAAPSDGGASKLFITEKLFTVIKHELPGRAA
jgi:hypothetical protein